MRSNWQPGEHVAIWGKTGSGKTTVCAGLVTQRQYAAVLASKQEDKTLELYHGFEILERWSKRNWHQKHVIVWPYARRGEDVDAVFKRASYDMMESIYWEKHWTLQIDDAKMMRHLGLMEKVRSLFAHCRSQGSSLVYNDVRPFHTIQEALDQTSYNLMFFQKDRRDVWRLAEANGENPHVLEALNSQLRRYEFLFLPAQGEPVIVRN